MSSETANPILAEIWRGDILESVHRGTAAICTAGGALVAAWGDPGRIILPRSACKMVQALPLIESGAADNANLTPRHLAIACASHQGAAMHTRLVTAWLSGMDMHEHDLRCGPQIPSDAEARQTLRQSERQPDQTHNNCSGKHTGFLTLNRHLRGKADYVDPDHPVQQAVRQASAEMAGEELSGFAIDGCSAPNFALTIRGLATQMARFADPKKLSPARRDAVKRLRGAMAAHPMLVAGQKRACTALIEACDGKAVVKTGAEGVFTGILIEQGLGIAIKCDDGSSRGSEAAITALLAHYGALDRKSPAYKAYADQTLLNRRGIAHGHLRAGAEFLNPPA